MKFQVPTATCGHCVRTITQALQRIAPGISVDVDLAAKVVHIAGPITVAQAGDALMAAGHRATLLVEPGAIAGLGAVD